VKVTTIPNAIYMFIAIPIKFEYTLHWHRKVNLKVHKEGQKILNSQRNPEPKEQHRRYHNTWLQTIWQSYSNKTAWCWHKDRHEDDWNRIENPFLLIPNAKKGLVEWLKW
jgi:hypothetical protein